MAKHNLLNVDYVSDKRHNQFCINLSHDGVLTSIKG